MNHTGVRSTGSRRAARTSSGSTRPRLAAHGERAARRPLARLDAGTAARRRGRRRARRAREHRHGRLARRDPARLPLARRPRQPDRLGRRAHGDPELAPGERATVEARVRAPIPPGRYRFALDLVAEHRAWFSELGSEPASADGRRLPRRRQPHAELPDWVEPAADWNERVAAAHAEGYAVVAGAIDWDGGLLRPRPRALEPYEPGPGRIPNFPHPLLCPSVLDGVELERLPDVAGLPAYAAPADEPWIYDGRIVLDRACVRRRCGAQSSIAIRSSIRLKTSAPSASATTAATAR